MQANGRTLMALMLLSASIIASGCGNTGMATQSAAPSQSPVSAVNVTLTEANPSAGPFYLDGAYSLRFSITHSSEQCLLAVYARSAGETVGTTLFSDVVFGNTGTFPNYSQSFEWDDAKFYGENYTIVSESACEEIRIQLLSRNPVSVSSVAPPTPTPAATPPMSIVPTPTPSAESIANGNICAFVAPTELSRVVTEGSLPYEFGQISLSQLGGVYSDWAKEGTTLLAKNKAATPAIIKEAKRLIAIAERGAAAAKAGKGQTALDLGLSTVPDTKTYEICAGF